MSALHPYSIDISKVVAGDFVPDSNRQVVFGDEQTTVEQCLDLLAKHNILSLPLMKHSEEKAAADKEAPLFIGIVNLWDVATALCFSKLFELYDGDVLTKEILKDDVVKQFFNVDRFKAPVGQVLGLSEESKTLWMYEWNDEAPKLLDAFAKGVHRVLLRGENTKGSEQLADYRMLSQSDVVRFLFASTDASVVSTRKKNLSQLHLLDRHPLKGASSGDNSAVVHVTDKESALTGFRRLTLFELNALPVVDSATGKLLATLSHSDIRGLSQDTFSLVLLPCVEFLKEVAALNVRRRAKAQPPQPVICKGTDTLDDIMRLVVQTGVHRCWVVDENNKPKAVVSLSDIITVFSPFNHLE